MLLMSEKYSELLRHNRNIVEVLSWELFIFQKLINYAIRKVSSSLSLTAMIIIIYCHDQYH